MKPSHEGIRLEVLGDQQIHGGFFDNACNQGNSHGRHADESGSYLRVVPNHRGRQPRVDALRLRDDVNGISLASDAG